SGGCAEEQGGGHGGGRAFATDVAEQHALSAIEENTAEIEVAADFAHGVKGDVDAEAWRGIDCGRGQHALNLAGWLHLAGQGSTMQGSLPLVAQDEDDDGGNGRELRNA